MLQNSKNERNIFTKRYAYVNKTNFVLIIVKMSYE